MMKTLAILILLLLAVPAGAQQIPAPGQATKANSVPVVLPSDQTVDVNCASGCTSAVAPTTIFNGNKVVTTAGTRVTLAASTTIKGVTVKALSTNTGIIYVGNTTVAAANGFQLKANESVSIAIADLATVNLDSSVNGEGVTYAAVN